MIAITRAGEPVQLHPRRDALLGAGNTVHLVGPYRELLATLRRGRPPPPQPATDDKRLRMDQEVNVSRR